MKDFLSQWQYYRYIEYIINLDILGEKYITQKIILFLGIFNNCDSSEFPIAFRMELTSWKSIASSSI